MSTTDITVPEGIADKDAEIVIANWLAEDGEIVEQGDVICELMVTKVTFEVEATASGRLVHRAAVEDIVAVGAILCVITSP